MTSRADPHPVPDLFVKDIVDYAPKDERTMMERPFFALGKRKRNKPIEYESDDGSVWVKVNAHPEFGMATIWDADILIWCISRIVKEREAGRNLESARIVTTPYELLTGIARATGGHDYRRLYEAINRLRNTTITTNIRAGRKQHANFNWLAEFEGEGTIETPEGLEKVKSIVLTLPRWIYDAISKTDNVLTLDRDYFLMTGGLERVLYRMARKHAGNQAQGWTCSLAQLLKKSGSEASMKKFAEMIKSSVDDNALPRYKMTMTKLQDGSPAVHFVDRLIAEAAEKKALAKAELARIEQIGREDARAALIDSGGNPRHAKTIG